MSTFLGNISIVIINGIGIWPIQLKKTMHAKQNGGIHSYPGCLSHNKQ